MALYGSTVLNLADWAKRRNPDGKTAQIVEILGQTNEMLPDMLWKEANGKTYERVTIRSGLPSVYWKTMQTTVAPSKSSTVQVDESCGILEAWSEVDTDVASLEGNAQAFRLSEALPFIESMNQEMQQTIIYGNSSTAPEEFNGLTVRYNSEAAETYDNVVIGQASASGSDYTSIWLVVWGPNSVYGIFPQGSAAGLQHDDYGEQTVRGASGVGAALGRAYQERWQWKGGLVVKDWRYACRGGDIDAPDLVASAGSAADIERMMIKMLHRIPSLSMGNAAFYCNRTVMQELDLQNRAVVNGNTIATAFSGSVGGGNSDASAQGSPVLSFRGVPIRTCDQILNTETAIAA